MKLIEILPEEANRADLFLVRNVGEYNDDWNYYLQLFNLNVNFCKLTSGTVLRVPSRSDIDKVRGNRNFFIQSFGSN